MKKLSKEFVEYSLRRQIAWKKREIREAGVLARKKFKIHKDFIVTLPDRQKEILTRTDILKKKRSYFNTKHYKMVHYNSPPRSIKLNGEFGMESNFDEFIKISSEFICSKSSRFTISLEQCSRIWPTGITLLCSFKQWTDITAHPKGEPIISSSDSNFVDVNSYLSYCGFYDYVNRSHDIENMIPYDDERIVKIHRETEKNEIDSREEEIFSVLRKFSILNSEQLEKFGDVVLVEVFNNVTEHGTSYRDNGWWTITQYHEKTGIISLCLADNGIGIKNSLLTGPQEKELLKKFSRARDGDFVKEALCENVSGAITGSTLVKGKIFRNDAFPKGSRRGNGLKRIKDTCTECKVIFNLISQNGFLSIDKNGHTVKNGTTEKPIFAGTLYHFIVPAIQKTPEELRNAS